MWHLCTKSFCYTSVQDKISPTRLLQISSTTLFSPIIYVTVFWIMTSNVKFTLQRNWQPCTAFTEVSRESKVVYWLFVRVVVRFWSSQLCIRGNSYLLIPLWLCASVLMAGGQGRTCRIAASSPLVMVGIEQIWKVQILKETSSSRVGNQVRLFLSRGFLFNLSENSPVARRESKWDGLPYQDGSLLTLLQLWADVVWVLIQVSVQTPGEHVMVLCQDWNLSLSNQRLELFQ